MRRSKGFLKGLLLLVVAVVGWTLSGCAAKSDYMVHPETPPTIVPSPAFATVVFIRPSSMAGAIVFTILDERGRFLGDSEPSSHFAVQVPPGEHLFVAWAENTAPMRAYLAPGRTYYVEVASRMGALSSRVHLLTIAPRTESYPNLAEWMAETDGIVTDEASGQSYLRSRQGDVAERIRRAQEAILGLDAQELAERTLYVEDGIGGQMMAPAPLGPPPAGVVPMAPPPAGAPPPAPVAQQ